MPRNTTILLAILTAALSCLAEPIASSTNNLSDEYLRNLLQEQIWVPKERATNSCPKLTKEELRKHLEQVQLQAIREGKPPLPSPMAPLTPEQIQQLIERKQLPKAGEPLQPGMMPAAVLKDLISRGFLPAEYLKSLPDAQEPPENQTSSTNHVSYAARWKQITEQLIAKKKRDENSYPKLTGKDLSNHLAEVQIQAIRQGKPPLSMGPFTPEQIQHLIEKKLLPKPGEPLQPGMIPASMLKNLINSGLLPAEFLKSLPEPQEH